MLLLISLQPDEFMNKHREEKEEQLHSPEPEPEPEPEEPEQHTTCDHVDECVLRMEVNTLTPRYSSDVSEIRLSELNVSPAATRRSAHWTNTSESSSDGHSRNARQEVRRHGATSCEDT